MLRASGSKKTAKTLPLPIRLMLRGVLNPASGIVCIASVPSNDSSPGTIALCLTGMALGVLGIANVANADFKYTDAVAQAKRKRHG